MTDDLQVALDDARAGGEWGSTCLYRSLNPLLLRYLRHRVGPLAEDLAQDTWMAVAGSLPSFGGGVSDFRALVFTVAHRRVVDHYRRQRRRPQGVSLDAAGDIAALEDPADQVAGALSAQDAIDHLTRELPDDQAEVLVLRVVADLNVRQVADLMGRSEGSVRVLQHRALRRLQALLGRVVTK